jgi:hypothetical protein
VWNNFKKPRQSLRLLQRITTRAEKPGCWNTSRVMSNRQWLKGLSYGWQMNRLSITTTLRGKRHQLRFGLLGTPPSGWQTGWYYMAHE